MTEEQPIVPVTLDTLVAEVQAGLASAVDCRRMVEAIIASRSVSSV